MRMIDTQILVHMKAGKRSLPSEGAIASVSAKEFLLMYGQLRNRDRYYLSLQRGKHRLMASQINTGSPPGHPKRRQDADKVLIDFNNEFSSIIEYSNASVAYYINQSLYESFSQSLSAFPKQEQRSLKERFSFLLERRFTCFALEEESISIGLDLLIIFLLEYNAKANFNNTVRDCMILGTAIKHGLALQTEDKLLAKLAASRFGAGYYLEGEDLLIDFRRPIISERRSASESKGYINRGWRIAVDRQQGNK